MAKNKQKAIIISTIIIVAIVAAIILITIIINYKDASFIKVNGNSMLPTLKDGEIKLYKKTHELNRFDIVAYRIGKSDIVIQRIIGTPGEKIKIENNNIYINDKKIEDKYAQGNMSDYEITLNKDEYFILGDNRKIAMDSRTIGPVKKDNIIGVIIND